MSDATHYPPETNASSSHTSGLSNYLEKGAAAVHAYTAQIERDYARPAVKRGQSFFDERPVFATFLGVFAVLSAVPIFLFIGLSATTFIFLSLTAVFVVSVVSFVIISGLFIGLLSVLGITFVTSLFISFGLLSMYAFVHIALLVRQDGPSGAAARVKLEAQDKLASLTASYWPESNVKGDSADQPEKVYLAASSSNDSQSSSSTSDVKVEG